MTTVSPNKGHDPSRGNESTEKLMDYPELASLISELATTADDASELVKGLLQVETAQAGNHRNGSYTKTVHSGYGAVG